MKIELYARTLTQEYPDNRYPPASGISTEDRECWANWKFDWGDQKWRNGELLPKDAESAETSSNLRSRISSLLTREEQFGGLVYDPSTTAVFRVDEDGLEAVRHLAQGDSESDLPSLFGVSRNCVNEFLSQLQRYRLWSK